MNKLAEIYKALFSCFGPQKWWPVTEKGGICPEYSGGPKNEKQQLEVIFGAILTQNTNWKNVERAIIELNRKELIDAIKITKIENKKLAEIIKSSGYNNQKAERLKIFSGFLLEKYDGSLQKFFDKNIGELRKELLEIKGIGPETADSIILYAAKKPIFVVDAYTKRIMGRIGFKEETYYEIQRLFMESIPNSERLFNEYHALLVELGKSACKKAPLCKKCPLKMNCSYSKTKWQ